ncbi:hypothetical protein EJB05_44924, partial [Eragrostis curvula]
MALHRFRAHALSQILLRSRPRFSASHDPPVVSLNRLLCSAAATTASTASSPRSFAVEDYLVSRCGLTPAQAHKAAKRVSHLRSRSNPDAVLAFLGGTLGLPAADIAAAVVMDPKILCSDVERTLAPRIPDLSDLGLSLDEIARLLPLAPLSFRNKSLRRNLEFWLKELGSFDKLLQVVRMNSGLLGIDPDKVAKPNLALLQQCGLNASDLLTSNIYSPRLFTKNPKYLRKDVEQVEELGVQRGTRMFPRVLVVISLMSKEAYARRVQLLQKFGLSQDDVREIARKAPGVLAFSDQKIQGNMDFLMKDIGLDVPYIVQRPALITYSVERRLLPRHCLLKVLREKGLLNVECDYYVTAVMAERDFLQKFVLPYKDVVPGLADGYASKCSVKAANRVALQQG